MICLFDLDGTLLDSNGIWVEVDRTFLGRRGLAPTPEYEKTVARSIFPAAAAFTRDYYRLPDSPDAIMAEWEALAEEAYRLHAPLKSGARELLSRCREAGSTLLVFTACMPALCEAALARFGLETAFEKIFYAGTLGLQKHAPDSFRHLAELLQVPPEDCVLFEDSPENCAAAAKAGFKTVGVYDRYYDGRQEELRAVCGRYVRSLTELL